jgi:hypothetical protein
LVRKGRDRGTKYDGSREIKAAFGERRLFSGLRILVVVFEKFTEL